MKADVPECGPFRSGVGEVNVLKPNLAAGMRQFTLAEIIFYGCVQE